MRAPTHPLVRVSLAVVGSIATLIFLGGLSSFAMDALDLHGLFDGASSWSLVIDGAAYAVAFFVGGLVGGRSFMPVGALLICALQWWSLSSWAEWKGVSLSTEVATQWHGVASILFVAIAAMLLGVRFAPRLLCTQQGAAT